MESECTQGANFSCNKATTTPDMLRGVIVKSHGKMFTENLSHIPKNHDNNDIRQNGSIIVNYQVIHKSMKHFENSRQIDYATDRGSSYANRERNSPSFFF
jgi:hypothetical protein